MPSVVRMMRPDDSEQVAALAAREEGEIRSFVNLVYDRGGQIMGYVGASEIDGHIFAGPLLLREDASPYVAMRLGAGLEMAMIALKVPAYLLIVPEEMPEWRALIKRSGTFEDLGAGRDHHWYMRRLDKT